MVLVDSNRFLTRSGVQVPNDISLLPGSQVLAESRLAEEETRLEGREVRDCSVLIVTGA